MPFLTQGKTNWKFLLIVVVLAVIVGGGVLYYQYVPKECSSSADCEGKTNIALCVGEWKCIKGTCVWDCSQIVPPEDETGTTTYENVKCQEIQNIKCDRSFTGDYTLKYIKDLYSGGNYTEQRYKIITLENQDSIIRGSVRTYDCSCCGGTIGSEAGCEISEQYFNIPPDNSIVRVRFTVECSEDGEKTLEGQMRYNNELIDIESVGPILANDIWGDESLYNCY